MKTKNIALGGICTGLGVIILYFTNIIPVNTLAILTLASLIIPAVIILADIQTGIVTFIATSLIAAFVLPINYILMYVLFFGLYGIVKCFIEKINKIPLEIVLKLIFFNIVVICGYFLLGLFIGEITIEIPLWLIFVIAQPIFLIYDYALTRFISCFISNKDKYIRK